MVNSAPGRRDVCRKFEIENESESFSNKIYDLLDKFYGSTKNKTPGGRLERDILNVSECLVRNYNSNLVVGDFLDKLSDYMAKSFQDSENKHLYIRGIKAGIEGINGNKERKGIGNHREYFSGHQTVAL